MLKKYAGPGILALLGFGAQVSGITNVWLAILLWVAALIWIVVVIPWGRVHIRSPFIVESAKADDIKSSQREQQETPDPIPLRDEEGIAEEKLLALLQDIAHHFLWNRILDPKDRALDKLEQDIIRWESKAAEVLIDYGISPRAVADFKNIGVLEALALSPAERYIHLRNRIEKKIEWLKILPNAEEGRWLILVFGDRIVRLTEDAWAAYRGCDANQKRRIRDQLSTARQQRFRKRDIDDIKR